MAFHDKSTNNHNGTDPCLCINMIVRENSLGKMLFHNNYVCSKCYLSVVILLVAIVVVVITSITIIISDAVVITVTAL